MTTIQRQVETIDRFGLYRENWGQEIVPDAYSHPAKYARGLIRQIYRHMIEQGYIAPGDKIIDPFGGVALGALDAMRNGLVWYGCELEPKFAALGQQNIDLWNNRYSAWFDNWGSATLIQGDSRRLATLVSAVGGAVSSPPFGDSLESKDSNFQAIVRPGRTIQYAAYGRSPGQLGSMPEGDIQGAISSPPFGAGETRNRTPFQEGEIASMMSRAYTQDKQGITEGNLAHLDAGISSPPYADAVKNGEGPGARHDPIYHNGDNAYKASSSAAYGDTPGQLGQMDGGVSSPPYAETKTAKNSKGIDIEKQYTTYKASGGGMTLEAFKAQQEKHSHEYGDSEGQLSIETPETFWTAARTIVEQVYMVLKPGGYTAWVTKDYVRRGERVPFSDNWQALCESVGFEPVERIRAWVIEEKGTQIDIELNDQSRTVERKSFFRRLAERRAMAREHWQSLSRQDHAYWLWKSHSQLWDKYNISKIDKDSLKPPTRPKFPTTDNLRQYKEETSIYESMKKVVGKPQRRPTRTRILDNAQVAAWKYAGSPLIDISIRIDWEDVIVMQKPLSRSLITGLNQVSKDGFKKD